jgi:hypothetical protein
MYFITYLKDHQYRFIIIIDHPINYLLNNLITRVFVLYTIFVLRIVLYYLSHPLNRDLSI